MAINAIELMSGVTTNTTSTVKPCMPGNKTFYAEVVGTGSVGVTVTIYGTRADTAVNGILLATITLSGTTRTQDAAAVSTACYPNYYATTASISGTGATARVEVYY